MTENRKKIPWYIKGIWCQVNNDEELPHYKNHNGMKVYVREKGKVFPYTGISQMQYTDIEDGCLTFNTIATENGEFYGIEDTRISYNAKYNELEVEGYQGISLDTDTYCTGGLEAANAFLQTIIPQQDWYETINNLGYTMSIATDSSTLSILNVFVKNAHKIMPLLIEHKDENNIIGYAANLFKNEANFDDIKKGIPKKAIDLASGRNISLATALKASSLFNPSEVAKLVDILDYYKSTTDDIIKEICNIPNIDFTKFANYLIKQSFINGEFKFEVDRYNETLRYVKWYADYINCVRDEEEIDLYPLNLKMAHDAAVEANSIVADGKTYNVKEFRNSTKKYDFLAWEKDDYQFVIPLSPIDLVEEGKKLHHCVKTYIYKVTNGSTKIVLLRNANKPYMTIEVSGNKIIQAKKNCNELPNENDTKLLNEWAKKNGLLTISY